MSNVEIRINTMNRLKKIRNEVVYGTVETVIDELLQNCIRSFKVSGTEKPVIDIVAKDDILIIRDNGNGCSDPQSIFEFETSAWNTENTSNDNLIIDAFGQGGSESIFQIADRIQIRSRKWLVDLNVNNVLDQGNLNVDVKYHNDTDFIGFEICLTGEKIAAHIDQIVHYLKATLQYYPYSCYVNTELIEYKELQQVESIFKMKFDNEFYNASLGVQCRYTDLSIYFEKRFVKYKWLNGVMGVIELKPGAVTLKAPDRKDIISNDKYREFISQLQEDAKYLYQRFVSTNLDTDTLKKYAGSISDILDVKDYIDYLPDLEEITEEEIPCDAIISERDHLRNINQNLVEQLKDEKTQFIPGKSSLVFDNKELIPKLVTEAPFKRFKDSFESSINVVWVEIDKQEEYESIIARVKSYGIKVKFSVNELYSRAFKFLKIPHISAIKDNSYSSYIIEGNVFGARDLDNPEKKLVTKEKRLINVLNKIQEFYGLHDVFRISDVSEKLKITDDEKNLIDTTSKIDQATLKDKNKIYLDRESLQLSKIKLDTSKAEITKYDTLVVLLNVNKIASGLSELLYNTTPGTIRHFETVDKISKEIALLLASL